MLQSEFEDRIKFKISQDEYLKIELLYTHDPKDRNKDDFCKFWLKNDGIQWLLNERQLKINELSRENKTLKFQLEEDNKISTKQYDTLYKRVMEQNKQILYYQNLFNSVKKLIKI